MEHRRKCNTPWIQFCRTFFKENRNACVDILCYVKIMLRAEDRAGASIRIDQSQVTCRENKAPLIFLEIPDAMEEESKLSTFLRRFSMTSEGEQTKLVATMDTEENSFCILKIVKTYQGA